MSQAEFVFDSLTEFCGKATEDRQVHFAVPLNINYRLSTCRFMTERYMCKEGKDMFG